MLTVNPDPIKAEDAVHFDEDGGVKVDAAADGDLAFQEFGFGAVGPDHDGCAPMWCERTLVGGRRRILPPASRRSGVPREIATLLRSSKSQRRIVPGDDTFTLTPTLSHQGRGGKALLTENAGRPCKPGSVSRLLGRDGGHLSSPASVLAEAPASRCEPDCGQRCRWGRAANPGTSRTLMVPLFGLAPGGVWPPVRRRTRPGALTARFHPCRLRPRP